MVGHITFSYGIAHFYRSLMFCLCTYIGYVNLFLCIYIFMQLIIKHYFYMYSSLLPMYLRAPTLTYGNTHARYAAAALEFSSNNTRFCMYKMQLILYILYIYIYIYLCIYYIIYIENNIRSSSVVLSSLAASIQSVAV